MKDRVLTYPSWDAHPAVHSPCRDSLGVTLRDLLGSVLIYALQQGNEFGESTGTTRLRVGCTVALSRLLRNTTKKR